MKSMLEVIKVAIKAQVPVMFWSTPGVGKTKLMETLGNHSDLNVGIRTVVLSQYDVMVLGGYPGRETNELHGVITTWAKPTWLIDLENIKNSGKIPILVLDEFNRPDKFTLAAALRLVNELQIGEHKLPEGTIILAACNFDTDEDSDVNFLNEPTMTRWCHILIQSHPETWLEWASHAGINKMLTSFIRTNPAHLNNEQKSDACFADQVLKRLHPCNRTNELVSKIVNTITTRDQRGNETIDINKLLSKVYVDMITGCVGTVNAEAFIEYCRNTDIQLFTFEQMINPTKEVFQKLDRFIKAGEIQIINSSLAVANEEFPVRYLKFNFSNPDKALLADLDGFWKFLMACPVDTVASFLSMNGANNSIVWWSNLLRFKKTFGFPDKLSKRLQQNIDSRALPSQASESDINLAPNV